MSLVIGIGSVGRVRTRSWPRFAIDGLHRSSSLLAVVFLLVHVAVAVLDSFAPITLPDAVIPLEGAYRPIWLGLGAVAFDLLLAVAITSALRKRLGHAAWRAVHWLAYAAWPVAVLHGLGTGSDVRQGWMIVVYVGCAAAFLIAVVIRTLIGWPSQIRWRLAALGATACFALGVGVWLPSGPLAPHWARRSGTPPALLRSTASRAGHA